MSNSCLGQSFLDCGQPLCIVLGRLRSVGSDCVDSLSSCSLALLTGALCDVVHWDDINVGLLDFRVARL